MKWFLLTMVLFVVACDINPSKFGDDEVIALSGNIVYVKDLSSGLCFGLVASRKTGAIGQSGMGITRAPCQAVEHLLK